MSGQFYDNADRRSYTFPGVVLSTASVKARVIGPAGKRGRVRGLEAIVTTGVTTAPGVVTVDTNAGLTTPFETAVPVAAANAGHVASAEEISAGEMLPPDTVVEISTDGAPGAGAVTLVLTIDWF